MQVRDTRHKLHSTAERKFKGGNKMAQLQRERQIINREQNTLYSQKIEKSKNIKTRKAALKTRLVEEGNPFFGA